MIINKLCKIIWYVKLLIPPSMPTLKVFFSQVQLLWCFTQLSYNVFFTSATICGCCGIFPMHTLLFFKRVRLRFWALCFYAKEPFWFSCAKWFITFRGFSKHTNTIFFFRSLALCHFNVKHDNCYVIKYVDDTAIMGLT